MITLNQPGFKSFVTYVFSFIFLTLFIYLGIPFFFDYKSNESKLEKKILDNFGLNLNFTSKAKYNIFPSPRLNLQNVEILSFQEATNNIGYAKKVVLKIPFKKLISIKTLAFDSAELINAVINIKTSEINKFKNYLNNTAYKKSIQLKKSKINLFEKTNLLLSIDSKKLSILNNDSFNKVNLKGQIFNTKIKINYQNENFNKNTVANIMIAFPEIGLNLKANINTDKKDNQKRYGRASVFFPNNQLYFDYILNNNIFNISSSRLINNYFKGQLFVDLILFPFLNFDSELNINILKFQSILNSKFVQNNKFLSQLISLNKKINGTINIKIDKITSSSNIINSGNANLEFKNGAIIFKEIKLEINKIGNTIIGGKILQQKKKKLFIFDTKINLDNSEVFYSRFLIPRKKQINLKPINLSGKINLESYKIDLDQIYFGNQLEENQLEEYELTIVNEKINEIFLQNSLDNILKYSNLRKIIQSFF
tara:strand:+ start:255 stop:1697 length:1443 start_codon:yes stop_codon:yes gene_type:complete